MVSNTRLLDQHAELPNNFLAYVQGKFVISLVPPSAPLLFIINNVLTFFARMPHFTYYIPKRITSFSFGLICIHCYQDVTPKTQ